MSDTLEPLYKLIHQGLLATGNLQADAYAGYAAWTGGRDGIDLASCWAHARREFHEALKIGQRLAAGPVAIIAKLYQIETGLRESRATAVGKNWLFVGSETSGQRAAIIYIMVECAKRHGHNPKAWLTDVLERLPAMTNQHDLSVLLPANWQPATAANKPLRETCPA